jgi:hypothetical protein
MNFENLDFSEKIKAMRAGPKSAAQTPAKPEERKKGSSKNKPGSAGTKPGAKETAQKNLKKKDEKSMTSNAEITFSEKVTKALKEKVKNHNAKSKKKVTLSQLKKVYRRGAGAFSSSHRPGMSRGGWAMARVNMFLKMVRGGKVKESYRKADQDISKSSYLYTDEGSFNPTMEDIIEANLDIEKYDIHSECDCDYEEIFAETDEGFEQIIDEESWAAENKKGKTLNKPFRTPGGPKKFSVYVKNEKGNVVKVNFGDPNMEIKRDDPARRKSFRARHNCANPGPKTKARYWSCKQWRSGTKVQGSDQDFPKEESDAKGLWENIRNKKKRMGKNYRPAKPGDKDRPTKEALEKAKGLKEDEKNFKPHAMFDKDGKKHMAKTYEDHLKMKKMGYTHESKSADQEDIIKTAFMKHCASHDKDLIDTKDMDDNKTHAACAMQYKKMASMLNETSEAGLTEKQKTLPPFLQKKILEKKNKESKK